VLARSVERAAAAQGQQGQNQFLLRADARSLRSTEREPERGVDIP
jgi:hypothetical protein